MKKRIVFVLLCAVWTFTQAQVVTVNAAGVNVSAGTTLTVNGGIENKNGATLSNNGNINLTGDWINSATYSGTGTVEFNSNYTQSLTSGGSSFAVLKVNKTGGTVNLLSGTQVNSQLDLSGTGNFILTGNNNLAMGSGASINNASSASYVVTNGTGMLVQNQTGTSAREFPVGTSTAVYTPAVITNAGTNDDFGVRVFDSVYTAYNGSGTATGSVLTPYQEVHKTWIINEGTAGGSNAIVQLQWNAANEGAVFARSNCAVSYYNGSAWVKNNAGGLAGGSNPYTRSSSAFTSFTNTPYGVGSSNSPLPVQLLDFIARRAGNDAQLIWSTDGEHNTSHFVVERSADASHWETIGTVKAAGNSNTLIEYRLTDKNIFNTPDAVIVYFRLKPVDVNGDFSYSPVRVLSKGKEPGTVTKDGNDLQVYPNPSTGVVLFTTDANTSGAVAQVFDVTGKLLISQPLNTQQKIHSLDMNAYASGMYVLVLHSSNGQSVRKLEIRR